MDKRHRAKYWIKREAKYLAGSLKMDKIGKQKGVQEGGEVKMPKDVGLDMHIPEELQKGVELIKRSEKHKDKTKQIVFKIDPDGGQVTWESKKGGCIPIESIKELRQIPPLSLHIIYIITGNYKSLNLLFPTKELYDSFYNALSKLHNIRQGLAPSAAGASTLADLELRDAVWERQYWKGADEEGDQKLDFDDVERLCRRLNVRLTKEKLQELIKESNPPAADTLNFLAFQRFVRKLKQRPELEKVYKHLAGASTDPKAKDKEEMDWTAFEKWMRGVQKSRLTDEDLKSLFSDYATAEKNTQTIPFRAFSYLLSSPALTVFKHDESDMTQPLSAYYISSSHNTYLVGHQLVGVSTTEGYIRSLLHSCRSVEMDIYDSDDGPVVYHGKTLTSPVTLRDICSAIHKYGFVTSPYPIILSAEVHCSVKGQEQIVDVMEEVFGDSLIKVKTKDVDGKEGVEEIVKDGVKIEVLPNPEELKGKVMVKTKNLFEVAKLASLNAARQAEKAVALETPSETSSSSSEDEGEGGIKGNIKTKWRKLRGKEANSGQEAEKKEEIKMSLRLVGLLVYTVGIKCHGLGPDVPYKPQHMFSLSESAANRLIKASMRDLMRHTQGHLVRVYPKGTRVSSSNYEPHRFWAAGAQVVALNWQTFDLGYMINQVMFLRNNRAGYVLKPDALRNKESELLKKKTQHFFHVSIISAQQLPRLRDSTGQEIVEKSIMDPFVEVSLHIPDWSHSPFLPTSTETLDVKFTGQKDATTTQPTLARTVSVKTKVIKNNGFNPVWEADLQIPFDCVGDMTELIFVEFKVLQEGKDDDDDLPIGTYCAPLGCLEQGYRYLPLHDNQMSPFLFSTLFVKIDIRSAE